MSALKKYLGTVILSDLAIASNIRYGTMISKWGAVEIIKEDAAKVEAWAGGLPGSVAEGGGAKRRVKLWLKNKKLNWHCTGNPKDHDIFCKHCVAVALFLKQN